MFVDLGGIDGLVNYNEISYKGPVNPANYYAEGDTVSVIVLSYDKNKQHLSLSIKAALSNPWEEIKDRLEVGAGPILIYQRIRYSPVYAESFFVYGADIYARGYVYKGAFLEARYDLVNKPSYDNASRRLNVSHLLLGAGYAQKMGKIGYFNASLLFNVLNNRESIYRGTFGNFPPALSQKCAPYLLPEVGVGVATYFAHSGEKICSPNQFPLCR